MDRFTESVLIYVICPASYKFCAALIVLLIAKPNFLDASCCNVDVVNGGAGFLSDSREPIPCILNLDFCKLFKTSFTSFMSSSKILLPCFNSPFLAVSVSFVKFSTCSTSSSVSVSSIFDFLVENKTDVNGTFFLSKNLPVTLKKDFSLELKNSSISVSLSMISFTTTD